MDSFLPAPRSASNPLVIPFLDAFRCTFLDEGFNSPPIFQRSGHGNPGPVLDKASIRNLPPIDRASCLQSWLFFGLISGFFAKAGITSRFVESTLKDHAPTVVVKSTVMTPLMREWAEELSRMDQTNRDARILAANTILDIASEEIEYIDNNQGQEDLGAADFDMYVLASVLLSIRLLISYFRSTIQLYRQAASNASNQNWLFEFFTLGRHVSTRGTERILSSIIGRTGGNDLISQLPIPPGGKETLSALLLLNRFTKNGWCPVRAKQLCKLYDYSIVNYFCRIQRTDTRNTAHSKCDAGGDGFCIAYNLTDEMNKQYAPKHIVPSCSCPLLGTGHLMAQMLDIINTGFVPILSMSLDPSNSDIKVHKQDGTIPYIAVSHVWSDGLGNPHQNSLPWCQLRKLALVFKDMKKDAEWKQSKGPKRFNPLKMRRWWSSEQVFFWMDTLCIPVGHEMGKIKQAAMMHITPIFQGADSILVLDSELESLDFGRSSDGLLAQSKEDIGREQEELAARILGSKWIQRAWTLEEGALARDCYFLVKGNRTLDLGPLVPIELMPKDVRKKEEEFRKHKGYDDKKRRKQLAKRTAKNMQVKVEGRTAQMKPGDPEQTSGGLATLNEGFDVSKNGVATSTSQIEAGNVDDDIEMGQLEAYNAASDERQIGFQVPIKLILSGPLNENRKQAVRPYAGKREFEHYMETRSSQFVDAWNDLLNRSATKSGDSVLIFANILDFNAAAVRQLQPPIARLPKIIKSCSELPIGLLFNAGKSSRLIAHYKDTWMPGAIQGDRLVSSATIRRNQDVLRIDLATCGTNPLLVLHTSSKPHFSRMVFCVRLGADHGNELYIIEILPEWTSADSETATEDFRRSYEEAFNEGGGGICLLIDPGTGTRSINGFTGRGAIFSVLNSQISIAAKHLHLRYRAPIKAWTLKQWLHSGRSREIPGETLNCQSLDINHLLTLEYFVDDWAAPLQKRQVLPLPLVVKATKRKLITTFVTLVLAGIIVIGAIGTKCAGTKAGDQDYCSAEVRAIRSGIAIAAIPIIVQILRWQRRRSYEKWLATFRN